MGQAGFDFERNHYDRFGHFFQGFIGALLIREILLKRTRLQRSHILFLLVVACCLAISASYELIEWLAAVLFGSSTTDFIGTQGDVWDTQWDMFLATAGSITAQLCLAGLQDRQLSRKKHSG